MAETLTEDVGTLPKELLAFIERKAERAIEVLREIVTAPDMDSYLPMQQTMPPQGLASGLAQQLGLANQLGNAQQWPPAQTNWASNMAMQNTAGVTITGTIIGG